MSPELDDRLCKKYPKIFKNRYADMRTTAMCWGFECDDGWFNIIDLLCNQIQGHTDWKRNERANALRFNRALKRALVGNVDGLIKFFSYNGKITDYTMKSAYNSIESGIFRNVPEKVHQVVATQVKEKFGALRFYYDGGDEYISGLTAMAEAMSGRTCEVCGKPGESNKSGFISTLCNEHRGSYG